MFKYGKDRELQFNFLIDNPALKLMIINFFEINRKYHISIHHNSFDINNISLYYYGEDNNKNELIIAAENILYLDKIMIFFSANK